MADAVHRDVFEGVCDQRDEAYRQLTETRAEVARLRMQYESSQGALSDLIAEHTETTDDVERLRAQVAAAKAEALREAATHILNTVDPLLPGREARMACVQLLRGEASALDTEVK